ncbi:CsgE family curli-type amyloid fiber assembly protein [uncultured Lacinutrix sp.]|uniref:CsgE family curli-type amyloid fiber assembly protein n=1 Tax=uncultured Lacinutrix sp. TaxID=574032 RepID=UPI002615F469|nr:CsgE family curli-type amyloid fiber assembly protein [uncultured Lacinutrix sp.]
MLPKKRLVLTLVYVLTSMFVCAQKFYNKDVNALIKFDKTSEFTTFSATAENLTYSDLSLRYEFMVFKKDSADNTAKSLQGNRFFLEANEKKILSSITLNNVIAGKVTLLLLVYPVLDGEENTGAISKDRIEVTSNKNGQLQLKLDPNRKELLREEAQDGVFLQGLVVKKVLTKSGRDFYKYFYAEYFNKQIKTEKHIVIEEVPGQRRSTRISVKVDGQLVWQFFSQPKKDYLTKMANTALDRSIRYLQQLQLQKQTLTRY